MKKLLCLLLAAVMCVALLAGCDLMIDIDPPPRTDPEESTTESTAPSTTAPAGNGGSEGGLNPVVLVLMILVLAGGGVLVYLIYTGKLGGKIIEKAGDEPADQN